MTLQEQVRARQAEAALERERETSELRREIAEIVLGPRNRSGAYLTEIVTLPSGGHVVGARGVFGADDETVWTTVYGGKRGSSWWSTDALAMISLLCRQSGIDVNEARHLVPAAARLLQLPQGARSWT